MLVPLLFSMTIIFMFFFNYGFRDCRNLLSFPTRRSSDLHRREEHARCAPEPTERPCLDARLPLAQHGQHTRLKKRSEEHTSELQSQSNLVCRLLLEKKKTIHDTNDN